MRFKPAPSRLPRVDRTRAGFTLVEVLAALLFMAIVIPVAVEGVRVASRAGSVGARKAVAARIAERVLNEQAALNQTQSASQSGTVEERGVEYQWKVLSEPWSVDQLTLLTVQVVFPVQGENYDLSVSTLVDPNAASTQGTQSTQTTE